MGVVGAPLPSVSEVGGEEVGGEGAGLTVLGDAADGGVAGSPQLFSDMREVREQMDFLVSLEGGGARAPRTLSSDSSDVEPQIMLSEGEEGMEASDSAESIEEERIHPEVLWEASGGW